MNRHLSDLIGRLGPLAVLAVLSALIAPASADPLNSHDRPETATQSVAQQAIQPIPVPAGEEELIVDSIIADPIDECHIYRPPVRYRVRGRRPRCCAAKQPVEVTMLVKDPASCDDYAQIPVCLPRCCVGEATICNRPGILGRRWVDYEWDCGIKISILFRTRGDVVVNYIF